MVRKILCVAEKPSIAKAVANHLGGHVPAVRLCHSWSLCDIVNVAEDQCARAALAEEL